MSRCFPFPPPGYERKPGTDDVELLTKEKRKEKKHKDKNDKERKEAKEKKNKEKSNEKHRERKQRKERHKDRDNDKKDEKKEMDKEHKNRDNDETATSDEKRVEKQPDCYKGKNSGKDNKDFKFMQVLARRVRDEDGAHRSRVANNSTYSDQGKSEIPCTLVENSEFLSAENDKFKKKNYWFNGQKICTGVQGIQSTSRGSTVDSCFSRVGQRGLGSFDLSIDQKYVVKQMEDKWKSGCKEYEDNCDKVKHRDQEKRISENNKYKDKEEKDKMWEISKAHTEQPGLKDAMKDSVENFSLKHSYVSKNGRSSFGDGNHLGKRKELGIYGYSCDNGIPATKLPRYVSSSNPVLGNGMNVESCQTASEVASENHRAASNGKISIKGKKVNGLIDPQQPYTSSSKSLSFSLKFSENGEGYQKPPHPDLKYLNQILSVPSTDNFPEIYDYNQDWLFSYNDPVEQKSEMSIDGEALQQVWAEALRIPCDDVLALPYVIPY